MRLGELLRQKGLLTPEQLQTALHEQSRLGGRLGTNLIHLGYVAMDAVALALSDQHLIPPVLREHVALVDKRVLALFPASLVLAHKAIPIGVTVTKPVRAVVACVDPARLPMEELAFAAGRRIEPWVAPELLLQECLEKYFGVPPAPPRYVDSAKRPKLEAAQIAAGRVKDVAIAPPPPPAPAPEPSPPAAKPARASRRPKAEGGKGAAAKRGLSPPPPPPGVVGASAARTLEMPDMPALAPFVASASASASGSASALASASASGSAFTSASAFASPLVSPSASASRPAAFSTASLELDLPRRPPVPPPPVLEEPPEEVAVPPAADQAPWWAGDSEAVATTGDDWDIPDDPDDAPPAPQPMTAPPDALRPVIDLGEASRMLEMATSKDQIGQVLEDWLRSTFGCGLVLVVKGDMAIGWKGFFPDAEDMIEAVAITLGKPSMFSAAYESHAPFRGVPPGDAAGAGAKLQERLWKLLRCAPPTDCVVCPVTLGKRTVNLLYAHMEDGSPVAESAAEEAATLARGAAAAYARLIEKKRS